MLVSRLREVLGAGVVLGRSELTLVLPADASGFVVPDRGVVTDG